MQPSWTPDQWKFIEWLASPKYDRLPPNEEMFAASIGVNPVTLWRWKKEEGFQDEVNKLARASLGAKLPALYGALIREAEAGSYQHLQLAFEMTGEYVKQQRNINQSDVKGELTIQFVEAETAADDDA
jgi:hypothetical protein